MFSVSNRLVSGAGWLANWLARRQAGRQAGSLSNSQVGKEWIVMYWNEIFRGWWWCIEYTLWCRCMSYIIVPLCHVVIESYRHQKLNELRYIKTKKKQQQEGNGMRKEQVKVERLMTFYFHLFCTCFFYLHIKWGVRAQPQPFTKTV